MKRSTKFLCLFSFTILLHSYSVNAQIELDDRAVLNFEEGLGFLSPDSLYGVNLRFRMQNRVGMTTVSSTDLQPEGFEANVRRLRLRFDGFMGQNNFTYYLQLSFSRGDQDWDNTGFPGIVRDAMVFYNITPKFFLGFGQGKLPGNRQRLVSSGSLQFADRSNVNAVFNIDRDFGITFNYSSDVGRAHYRLRGAISSGEGRNITRTDNGLAYTGRVEILPMGRFKSSGDYFEGDILREPKPKLSFGTGASYNHKSLRSAGQRGSNLPEAQNILSYFADMVAKYNGWAMTLEYALRHIEDQEVFVIDQQNVYSFTGWGFNGQLSYVFTNDFEIAGRYTFIEPGNTIKWFETRQRIYTLGLSKYLRDHRTKIQLNILLNENPGQSYLPAGRDFWNIMFQVETGI